MEKRSTLEAYGKYPKAVESDTAEVEKRSTFEAYGKYPKAEEASEEADKPYPASYTFYGP